MWMSGGEDIRGRASDDVRADSSPFEERSGPPHPVR